MNKRAGLCALAIALLSTATSAAEPAKPCFKTFIREPAPFLGNGGEIIVLGDGSIWKESSYQYLYLYAYNPQVVVCPADGTMTTIGIGAQRTFQLTRIKSSGP